MLETSNNCARWCSATTYQKLNSSVVSKGAMKSFNEMFPLVRIIFPLAVMHICVYVCVCVCGGEGGETFVKFNKLGDQNKWIGEGGRIFKISVNISNE